MQANKHTVDATVIYLRWFLMPKAVLHVHSPPYLFSVVGLLLALCPWLAGASLLSELLQTGLQLQLLLAGLAELPSLLTVYRFQLATQLSLLCAQLP